MDNAPPVLTLERKWNILESEPVGSVVTRVRGTDSEGDPLVYGLEHLTDYNVDFSNAKPLPFIINNLTGVVYTNQSLIERVRQSILFYVFLCRFLGNANYQVSFVLHEVYFILGLFSSSWID
jgi:hypothetical protein